MSGIEDSELKPFRIPRKSEKIQSSRREPAANIRSSVVNAPAKGGHQSQRYGNRIVPLKRKATSSTEKREKRHRESSPVGHILQSMVVPSAKKQTGKEKEGISETDSSLTPAKFSDRRPGESGLTKEKLERHSSLQEYYCFGNKGLMEALLEHKMKTGRIDSHQEIGQSLSYRTSFQTEDQVQLRDDDTSPLRKGPRTPPGTPPSVSGRKGPATPPDSPPPNTSSTSRSPSFRGRSSTSSSSSSTDSTQSSPHPSPSKNQQKPAASAQEGKGDVLQEIAAVARVDVGHLKSCLSSDVFNTLHQLDSSVLLATVSTVLNTIAHSIGKGKGEGNPEVTSSSLSPKGVGTGNQEKSADVAVVSSTGLKDESVEMELESDEENNSKEVNLDDSQIPIIRVDLTGSSKTKEEIPFSTQHHNPPPPLPPAVGIPGPVPANPPFRLPIPLSTENPLPPVCPPTSAPPLPPLPVAVRSNLNHVSSENPLPPVCPATSAPPLPPPPAGAVGPPAPNPNHVQIIQTLLQALAIPKPTVANISTHNLPVGTVSPSFQSSVSLSSLAPGNLSVNLLGAAAQSQPAFPPTSHPLGLPDPPPPSFSGSPLRPIHSGPPLSKTEAFMAQLRPEIRSQVPVSGPPPHPQSEFVKQVLSAQGPLVPVEVLAPLSGIPRAPPPCFPPPGAGNQPSPSFNDSFMGSAPPNPRFPIPFEFERREFRACPPPRFFQNQRGERLRGEERPFRPPFGAQQRGLRPPFYPRNPGRRFRFDKRGW